MRVVCLIDSLGSGGAQRQLTTLAVGLQKRGHDVRFLVYHPYDHFLPLLQAAAISCRVIPPCSRWRRALAVRRILRQGWQEVVLAFLDGPCLYAELAGIPGRHWGLVVGERSGYPLTISRTRRFLRHFHRFADGVVCNSHTMRLLLQAEFPFLRRKMVTVYNMVDLQLFCPSSAEMATAGRSSLKPFRIVVAASYTDHKNIAGVAKALHYLKNNQGISRIIIDWFGSDRIPAVRRNAERFVAENGLTESLRLNNATRGLADELRRADAVGLFSFSEGLPNVVCEGMACGKPIVLSNVCDAGNLVQNGKNGFLCDPSSPESIANALSSLAATSGHERSHMGLESRRLAEELFDGNAVIDRYERILLAAARHKPFPTDCTWPAEVPASAVKTAEEWASGSQARWESRNEGS